MTEIEIWKIIPRTLGMYEVSNIGNVRSLDRIVAHKTSGLLTIKGRPLKPTFCKGTGYFYISVCIDAKREKRNIHELVCLAFLGERPEGCHIDHGDKNRQNNRLINLTYKTVFDNCSMPGSKHPFALLTEAQVLEIRDKYKPRQYTAVMLGKEYGVDKSTINKITSRINWRHI